MIQNVTRFTFVNSQPQLRDEVMNITVPTTFPESGYLLYDPETEDFIKTDVF